MQAISSQGPDAIAYHTLGTSVLLSPDLPCPLQYLCTSNTPSRVGVPKFC